MNRRHWRTYVLEPNHETRFPSAILYLDTETHFDPELTEQDHTFRLAVLRFQRYVRGLPSGRAVVDEVHSVESLWRALLGRLRENSRLWVMAHNMDFDFAAIEGFERIVANGFKVSFWAFAQRVFILRAERGRGSLLFLDSSAYLTGSIKALGQRFSLDKLSMPDPGADEATWMTYCARDVEILQRSFEAFIAFVRVHDLGKLALTGPGQAMAAYRHRFMDEKIVIHRIPRLLPVERAAYHGGRTEAFFIGQIPQDRVWYLDVQSMYPYAMKAGAFPCEFLGALHHPRSRDTRECLRKFEVLAECEVETQDPVIPVVTDKLLFPVGRFKTTLAGPEFRYCYESGRVRSVDRLLVYRRGKPFGRYVNHFWDARQTAKREGNEPEAWLCKLLHNALYGKFAQNNPDYDELENVGGQASGIYYTIDACTHKREIRLVIGDKVWMKRGEHPAATASYPLAAWVTSYARLRLWALMERAGRDHVYYCDTDSLFVDAQGYANLRPEIRPDVLGALDLKQVGSTLEIHGLKDYVFDGEARVKGVPSSAVWLSPNECEYPAFDHLRTRMRKGSPDVIHQRKIHKTLSRDYTKGVVLDSGWVVPLDLTGH